MGPVPAVNEQEFDLLVRYARGDEATSTAVVNAFSAANCDVFGRETTLQDWINPDALDRHEWGADPSLAVSTRIWDRQVVVTAEDVWIYAKSPGE